MEYGNQTDERRWAFASNTWAEREGYGWRNILKEILLELEKEPDTGFAQRKANIITKLREVKKMLSAVPKKGYARFRRSPNDKQIWKKVEDVPLSLCIAETNHQRPPQSSDSSLKTLCPTAGQKVENFSLSCSQPYPSGYSLYRESPSQYLAIDPPHMYDQVAGGCSDASAGPYSSSTQALALRLSLSSVYNHSSGVRTEAAASPYNRVVPLHLGSSLMPRDSNVGSSDAATDSGPSSTQTVPFQVNRYIGKFIPPSHETLNLLVTSTPSSPVCVSGKRRRQRLEADGYHDKVNATKHVRRSPHPTRKRVQRTSSNTILVSAVSGRLSNIPPDDYAWRKYGQKPIRDSSYPRSYYRCSITRGCPARKQVERSTLDPTKLFVTYKGEHKSCSVTVAKAPQNSLSGNMQITKYFP